MPSFYSVRESDVNNKKGTGKMLEVLESGSYIATMVGVLLGVCGGAWALVLYRQDRRVQKANFLNELIQRFSGDNIQEILKRIEEEDSAVLSDDWISRTEKDLMFRHRVDAMFRFFANVCYLMSKGMIDGDELSFFSEQLNAILVNNKVKRYLVGRGDDGVYVIKKSTRGLVSYAERSGFEGYSNIVRTVAEMESNALIQNRERQDSSGASVDEKVVLIRVSRLYRDGMTPEELWEITHAKWRARYDIIRDYKIAMAVVGGIVKGVFDVKEWQELSEEADKRVVFTGKKSMSVGPARCFVGKNISRMFPRGAANPIRYSTIGEIQSCLVEVK